MKKLHRIFSRSEERSANTHVASGSDQHAAAIRPQVQDRHDDYREPVFIPQYGSQHGRGHQYTSTKVRDNSCVVQGDIINNHSTYVQALSSNGQADASARFSPQNKKYDALRNSLAFTGMGARLRGIEDAFVDTGRWFLNTPEFSDWYQRRNFELHNGFLWLKGKPGCGKSTIMKLVYDFVTSQAESEDAACP